MMQWAHESRCNYGCYRGRRQSPQDIGIPPSPRLPRTVSSACRNYASRRRTGAWSADGLVPATVGQWVQTMAVLSACLTASPLVHSLVLWLLGMSRHPTQTGLSQSPPNTNTCTGRSRSPRIDLCSCRIGESHHRTDAASASVSAQTTVHVMAQPSARLMVSRTAWQSGCLLDRQSSSSSSGCRHSQSPPSIGTQTHCCCHPRPRTVSSACRNYASRRRTCAWLADGLVPGMAGW